MQPFQHSRKGVQAVLPRSLLRRSIGLVALTFLLAISFACTSRPQTPPEGPVTRQLTDDAGRRVSLPARVTRVISLAPNLTEIVFAVGAGDRLVGRTSYCDYPPEAKAVAEVGDTRTPGLEKIIGLRPQVVLVSTASQLEVFTQQLQNQNIAVFVTDPHDLEGVFRSIQQIGEILGHKEQADLLVGRLRERTNAVEQAVKDKPPVRVFYQVSGEPLYTAGRNSFVTDLMRRAGAVSVTAEVPGAWPKYSNESALASKPEAIILPTGGSMGSANSSVTEALRQSPAALQGRVYKINDDHLTRPGPRLIDGLEAMAKALHPDAFKQ
ncbi:MAG TPA: cobalamin-binding protein [Pyrinomonadaceae bacterium]|nr:cobalamin-binding protein [Pyrinomonadaceae bacterium]